MKILIVGSGGREHALIWSLRQTYSAPLQVFCCPGNAGIGQIAELVPIAPTDNENLTSFAREHLIDLTFVGPEGPLAAGLVDRFEAEGLTIIGPNMKAARLEASKVFAKKFMGRYGVPTAAFREAASASEAIDIIRSRVFGSSDSSIVIKADGLAAGKGVVVADSSAAAEKAVEDLMVRGLAGKDAAQRIVVEEALRGKELSLLLFSDGLTYAIMPAARDHKRIGENDTGPNTGGMGSITDPSILDSATLKRIVEEIVEPTLAGARHEGFPFKGILFLGVMLTDDGPKLLEYNVRFGDPEAQSILIRLKTDLVSVFEAIHNQKLSELKVDWVDGSSACVVLASRGYPGKYETGAVIEGLERPHGDSVQIFHAGTSRDSIGRFITNGGRVLGVTAADNNLRGALGLCYRAIEGIAWPGMQFRRDIGCVSSI